MKRTRRAISMVVAMAMMTPTLATAAEAAMVNWLSPAPGQRITTRTVEVAVGYNTQSDQKVTRLELWVDGRLNAKKDLVYPETRGVCSFVWDTAKFSDGPHDLVVKVYSGDLLLSKVSSTGTVGSSAFDMEPPVVTFIGIKSGDVIKGTAEINIKATDDSGEQPLVSFLVDNSLKLIKNRAPYTYSLDTTTYKNGSHALETYAYDGAGNKSDPAVVNVSFSNNTQRPVLTSVNVVPTKTTAASEDDGVAKIESVSPVAKVPPIEAIVPNTQAARVDDSISTSATAARPAAAHPIAPIAPKTAVLTPVQPAKVSVKPMATAVVRPATSAPKAAASVSAVTPLKSNQVVMAMATPEPQLSAAVRMARPVAPSVVPKAETRATQAPVKATASRLPAELAPISVAKSAVNIPSIRSEQFGMANASRRAAEPKLEVSPSVSTPKPILMAKAPAIRTEIDADMVSTAVSSATEVLADPISAAPGKTSAANQSAKLRSSTQVGCASVGTRMAMAPRSLSVAKPEVVPYVADATAMAKSKTHVKATNEVRIDYKAKLEKRVIPAKGKVKLRDLVNNGGGVLFWDDETHSATAYVDSMKLELTVGSNVALVNGKEMKMKSAPYIVNGRMVVNAQVYQQALAMANSEIKHTASAK